MKRIRIFALLMVLVFAGCSGADQKLPPGWDESWVQIAGYVGVEPLDGFTLNESNDVLSMSGLYYATWTSGDGRDIVNAEGGNAVVYDAQIYVLLEECRSAEEAEETAEGWSAHEKKSYETGESETRSFGTQSFELLPLLSGSEGNPYPRGTAAFAARDEWAISVELVCSESFEGDPRAILEQFLVGFHYREE